VTCKTTLLTLALAALLVAAGCGSSKKTASP